MQTLRRPSATLKSLVSSGLRPSALVFRLPLPTIHGFATTTSTTMASTMERPRFTTCVVDAMRSLYPEELADRRWDNVGLLLDNINPSHPLSPTTDMKPSNTVLLTIDLTLAVAEEAIQKKASVIVTYRKLRTYTPSLLGLGADDPPDPFIFRGFKSICLDDPHQRIALVLAQHNIAVYCPHTAVDAAPGGLNDALAAVVEDLAKDEGITCRRTVVQAMTTPVPKGLDAKACGYGRMVHLDTRIKLDAVVEAYGRLVNPTGASRYIMLARPTEARKHKTSPYIASVAVCAGSGSDVLQDCKADLLVTGEMSHHNALKAILNGQHVLTFFHSNSERFFLESHLRPELQSKLASQVTKPVVLVSEEDKDPFDIVEIGQANT